MSFEDHILDTIPADFTLSMEIPAEYQTHAPTVSAFTPEVPETPQMTIRIQAKNVRTVIGGMDVLADDDAIFQRVLLEAMYARVQRGDVIPKSSDYDALREAIETTEIDTFFEQPTLRDKFFELYETLQDWIVFDVPVSLQATDDRIGDSLLLTIVAPGFIAGTIMFGHALSEEARSEVVEGFLEEYGSNMGAMVHSIFGDQADDGTGQTP